MQKKKKITHLPFIIPFAFLLEPRYAWRPPLSPRVPEVECLVSIPSNQDT